MVAEAQNISVRPETWRWEGVACLGGGDRVLGVGERPTGGDRKPSDELCKLGFVARTEF